jgi:hypothetical protein
MHAEDFDPTQLPREQMLTSSPATASRADGGSWRLPILAVTVDQPGSTLVVTEWGLRR